MYYYGGAFFGPIPRTARRTSLGAILSSAGIVLGGLSITMGMFQTLSGIGSREIPTQGSGPYAWALFAIGLVLLSAAMANAVSHSRTFYLWLQIFAVAAGVTALAIHGAAWQGQHLFRLPSRRSPDSDRRGSGSRREEPPSRSSARS